MALPPFGPVTPRAHGVCMADIILDFELGPLNKNPASGKKDHDPTVGTLPNVARIPGYDWRAQVLAADGEEVLSRIINEYTQGATMFQTKGFYGGVGAPGYVIRILGSSGVGYLMKEAELFGKAKCLAHKLRKIFAQWDVWVLLTKENGQRSLWLASENEGDPIVCQQLKRYPRRRAA